MEPIVLTKDPTDGFQTFEEYGAEGGYEALRRVLADGPQAVLDAVEGSGLRGRGGACFPTGQKWRFAAQEPGPVKYVVANGGEDEPGSQKDRVVMEKYPHKILEGIILASYAIGATEAVLYVNSEYAQAITRLESAIAEATRAGYLGERIGGTAFSLTARIHPAPQEYVAGEDSAALEAIEGRRALPRQKPPFPTTAGLFGKPTLVNNVETFAYVPAIVQNGPNWFRRQGTDDNPGTMLFTLPANVRVPGVVELPVGTPLREIIDVHGGGLASGRGIKSILPGGPSSGFLGAADLDVAMDRGPLMERGSALGCGVMRIVEEGQCVVEVVHEIAQFFARESCAQCPACQMETSTIAKIIDSVQKGTGTSQMLDQIPKIGAFAKGKGMCSLISMPIPPLTSATRLFPEDFAFHLEQHACPAATTLGTG
ncbi:MAG: NADH-quinone oxidoreductase subunit F [Chloroflexi bacterium]|nr:NADH-quinone oxidoreductase subunit F [Chloroflexota bacterium]